MPLLHEVIKVTIERKIPFALGFAVQLLLKGNQDAPDYLDDLQTAIQCIEDEIKMKDPEGILRKYDPQSYVFPVDFTGCLHSEIRIEGVFKNGEPVDTKTVCRNCGQQVFKNQMTGAYETRRRNPECTHDHVEQFKGTLSGICIDCGQDVRRDFMSPIWKTKNDL